MNTYMDDPCSGVSNKLAYGGCQKSVRAVGPVNAKIHGISYMHIISVVVGWFNINAWPIAHLKGLTATFKLM